MESEKRNYLSKAEHDNYPTSGLGGPIRKLLTTLLHRKLVGMLHVQSFKEQSSCFERYLSWEIVIAHMEMHTIVDTRRNRVLLNKHNFSW